MFEARTALRQGCYVCLTQAIDRLKPFSDRDAAARQLTFELRLVLALRERELGLVGPDAAEVAQLKLRATREATYLDLVQRIPWAREAHRLDFSFDPRRTRRITPDELTRALEFLHTGPADPVVNDYLAISLACPSAACEPEIARVTAQAGLPPVLEYRVGITGADQAARLQTALSVEPRFDEVHFFLGRNALARTSSTALRSARAELQRAHGAFDRSATIAQMLAGVLRTFRDWEGALALYDAALTLVPNQEDALLGRTVALAQLRRYEESDAAATQLIDLGVWHLGDAHYWRAWSRLQRNQLDEALADVEAAKKTAGSTDVYTLAGLIRLKRGELRDARTELDQAIERDGDNCSARKYHGFVDTALAEPGPASTFFADAFDCFRKATDSLRHRAQDAQPAGDAPQMQRDIDESVREEADAALNAALAFARHGDADAARKYAAKAESYDATSDRAAQLLLDLKRRDQ